MSLSHRPEGSKKHWTSRLNQYHTFNYFVDQKVCLSFSIRHYRYYDFRISFNIWLSYSSFNILFYWHLKIFSYCFVFFYSLLNISDIKYFCFYLCVSFLFMFFFIFGYICSTRWAFQVTLVIKNLPANAGHARDVGSIPGLGRFPGVEKWQHLPIFLPRKIHGQRSLRGYSQWGHK